MLQAFLRRDSMRIRGLCCRPVSVGPYVCPSDTLVDCIHTVEDTVKLLFRPGIPITLSLYFLAPCANTQFQGESRQRRRKIHQGGKNCRFSTEIAVYLGNGAR